MSKTNKRISIKKCYFQLNFYTIEIEAFTEFILYFKMKISFVIMIRDNYSDHGPEPIYNL